MEITMEIINSLMRLLNGILNYVFSFLPKSPFGTVMDSVGGIPYLGYVVYFVPVGELMTITAGWLTAVGIFYLYQVILRWVKAIDD